jgi:CRP-like cAMP-binding protein
MMTTTEKIKQTFDPFFDAPLEVWRSFADIGEILNTTKDQIIKKGETTEKYLYFILNGCGGILLWNNNNYVCLDLCFEGDFFGDYMSFLNQESSPIEVVTFEPSELFMISKKNFDIISDSEYGNKICRLASEQLFIHKQKQQIDILTKTAFERYNELLTKQQNILKRTPQKYIASYLGITPESLSRIRKKLSDNHFLP